MYFPSRSKHSDDRHSSRDQQRQDWHQDDRDKDYKREKRSHRSSSNDRSYSSRRRSRDRERYYDEEEEDYYREERRRSRSPHYKKRSPDPPSSKLILTSLPSSCDRDQMNIILSQHGFCPIDVRVVKKTTETGASRSFGFIDFQTVDEAQAYMDYTRGILKFEDGFESRVEFARENDARCPSEKTYGSSDWFCAKCGINNFNRRTSCFKCGTTRKESDELEQKGYTYVGSAPCDTLLVRELPISANELSIISAFASYSNVPIQRVKISESRKYCFVQLKSIEDANYMLSTFNRSVPYIDNCMVIITFSRLSLNKILLTESVNAIKHQAGISASQVKSDPIAAAAMLAQNAIQMTQIGRFDPGRQMISTPLGVFAQYSKPDPRVFQQDQASGYFYDPNGFYYDAKTGFYFNISTQTWCFWTTKFSTYIPVEGDQPDIRRKLQMEERALNSSQESEEKNAETAAATETDAQQQQQSETDKGSKKEKKDETDKPKSAFEIQREMEKWAKKNNKKKVEQQEAAFTKAWNDEPSSAEGQGQSSTKRHLSESTYDAPKPSRVQGPEFDIQKYLDWTNLTCMLCQRQFKSSEILEKHCQKSDLHKSNVEAKMAEIGQALPASTAPGYRDRAKERRSKFGLDPGISSNNSEKTAEPETHEQRPLDESNIGNRMLKSMGWEGQGLGKNQQGIVNPITAEQRVQGVGLGASGSKAMYVSRKERMQQTTISRFNNIRD